MSRSNPKRIKKRSAKTTNLIYCEGLAEETFLRYLKSIYSYNSNAHTTIIKGTGGTADGIVMEALRRPGAYDRKIVVLDGDKPEKEMVKARSLGKREQITLIENNPCLEALLLSILCEAKSFTEKSSKWCKREFESKHLDEKKRGNTNYYVSLFPKVLLERMRKKIKILNSIICLIENKKPV